MYPYRASTQVGLSSQHCPAFCDGSGGPAQVGPQNPGAHSQVNEPMPSVQTSLTRHGLFPASEAWIGSERT